MDIVRITHLSSPTRTSPARAADRRARGALTARLNGEWRTLTDDPAVRAELDAAPIAGHHDLDALLAACGGDPSVPVEVADERLAQVVAAALEGRTLATRVVLQRVLGSLVRIAVRRTRSSPDRCAPLFDELCSTAWIVVGTYPLARRPRAIAANISRDCEYLTCVRPERLHDARRCVPLREGDEPTVDLWGRLERHRHARDELHALLGDVVARGTLVDADRVLLRALTDGASTAAIAATVGCTDRTIRNRRERLVGRLRELASVPAD